MLLMPSFAHALDCEPLRPDAPIKKSEELELKAEIGGLLKSLLDAGGEFRLQEAYERLSSRTNDADATLRWQSQFFLTCQVLNDDPSIPIEKKIEIIRGLEDAESQAQIKKISRDDLKSSVSAPGIDVTLQTCALVSTGTLGCDLTFLTRDTSKDLTVYAKSSSARSRLIDNQGNTYIASRVELGGHDSANSVKTELPPGVMMRGHLYFDNISRSATEAAILEIKGRIDRQDIGTYAFENVGLD